MPKPNQKKWIMPILWTAVIVLMGWFMLRKFEYSQVYHPSRALAANADELHRPFEELFLPVENNGAIHGWFFPAATNGALKEKVFLVCHGNAGNIGDRLDLASLLLNLGANVLLFDYRGYGRSTGRPSEEGTYQDAMAAYQWLRQKNFQGTNILAYGESLGGGIATELALRQPLGALILQSTFTSIPDVGAEIFPWLPVRLIGTIQYDTRHKLPEIKIPVLILHSPDDGLVAFHHAEENFAAANSPKYLVKLSGDHNDALSSAPSEIETAIRQLLK